jgi:hypothetical protein
LHGNPARGADRERKEQRESDSTAASTPLEQQQRAQQQHHEMTETQERACRGETDARRPVRKPERPHQHAAAMSCEGDGHRERIEHELHTRDDARSSRRCTQDARARERRAREAQSARHPKQPPRAERFGERRAAPCGAEDDKERGEHDRREQD